MPKLKVLTTAILGLCLASCNHGGTPATLNNNQPNVQHESNHNKAMLNNLADGSYDLDRLEGYLKDNICLGFGYNAKSNECHSTPEISPVENIVNLAKINPEFDLRKNPITQNIAKHT